MLYFVGHRLGNGFYFRGGIAGKLGYGLGHGCYIGLHGLLYMHQLLGRGFYHAFYLRRDLLHRRFGGLGNGLYFLSRGLQNLLGFLL